MKLCGCIYIHAVYNPFTHSTHNTKQNTNRPKKKIGKLHSNFNYHKLHIHNRKNRVVMGDFYISFFSAHFSQVTHFIYNQIH